MSFNVKMLFTADKHDCEVCGGNWAESWQLLATDASGRVVFRHGQPAVSHCWDSVETTKEECFKAFIEWLGHSVEDPYASHSDASGSFNYAKAAPEGEEE